MKLESSIKIKRDKKKKSGFPPPNQRLVGPIQLPALPPGAAHGHPGPVLAVEVAAAGGREAVFPGQAQQGLALLLAVGGIAALQPQQTVIHAVLDELPQRRLLQTVLVGVGQHRYAAGLPDALHRTLDGWHLPGQVVALPLVQPAGEGLGHALGLSLLHQKLAEVRPSDHRAEAPLHLPVVRSQPVRRHEGGDFPVALVPLAHDALQHPAENGGLGAHIVAQNVDDASVAAGELQPGHHLQPQLRPLGRGLPEAGDRVVVGDGDGFEPQLVGRADDLGGAQRPVRGGGVDVKVNGVR